jgi:hypothetical protein
MDWIAANWVWIVLFGGMLLLHTVGHGHGHGSRHSRHRAGRNDAAAPQGEGVDAAGREAAAEHGRRHAHRGGC